jgi:phage gpG-like protein
MEVVFDINTVNRMIDQMIIDKLEIAGALVESEAKKNLSGQNGPELKAVDTGNLMNSITHEVNEVELSVRIGTNVEYGPYIEFGTGLYAENGQGRKTPWPVKIKDKWIMIHGTHSRPFLRRALYDNLGKIKGIFTAARW